MTSTPGRVQFEDIQIGMFRNYIRVNIMETNRIINEIIKSIKKIKRIANENKRIHRENA